MIKVLEKEFLDDKFINKSLICDVKLNDKMYFKKDNLYYFGNYRKDKIDMIKSKINKNKRNIINAVEKGIRFIIAGNSYEIFNNSFKSNDINLFNCSYNNNFMKKIKNKIIKVDNLSNINNYNFRYKNLVCIKDDSKINKLIKKAK